MFRTVTIDSSNNVYRLTNYSAQGQVKSDSLFDSDGQRLVIGSFYTYNSSGKVQTTELYYPTIYANGYHWRYEYTYNDTLLARRDVYLKGRFTNYSTYTHSNSKKELTDSLFGNSGTAYANRRVSSYDGQDRLSTYITIGLNTDTTSYNVYQYGALYTEVLYKNIYTGEFSSKTRTDYNPNGTVLGTRYYAPLGTLQTQTNYSYDAGGHLLNTIQVASGNTVEEIYFNDPVYGIPNRTEAYRNGRLQFTKTFYYH